MDFSPKTKNSLKRLFVPVAMGCVLGLVGIGVETVLHSANPSPQQAGMPAASLNKSGNAEANSDLAKILGMVGIMKEIARSHVDEKNATNLDKMVTAALKGILADLDPHSDYLTPTEFKAMMEDSSGEFSGIGMGVDVDPATKSLRAAQIFENSPAERAGLKAGDIVTKIGDTPTSSLSLEENVKLIRGTPGTSVDLTVLHHGTHDAVPLTVIRAKVENPPVKSSKIGNVGYIRLSDFSYEKTRADGEVDRLRNGKAAVNGARLVRNAILKLQKEIGAEKVQGYVLDLRFNPGGKLYQAVDIADHLLDKGKTVVTRRGRSEGANESYETEIAGDITHGKPVVVLVNEASASASELLSGALQDYGRVTVLGRNTFGKGSVQEVNPLANGGALKLTVARYYTPKGHPVQNLGITPDILYTGKTSLDGRDIRKEAGLKNVLADKPDANPHRTSKTCGPVSEDMDSAALIGSFGKAAIGLDGKPDGMLLCAVETLQGKSKWTITQPYKMPAGPAALTQ